MSGIINFPLSFNRRDLFVITFFFGFISSISQVLLIRELLSNFRGNEFIIGIIFSSWFLGIYSGARFSGEKEIVVLEKRITVSLLLLPFFLFFSIYSPYLIQIIFPKTVGSFYSISIEFLFCVILTIPISFLIGFFFPPIVTLLSKELGVKSGGNIFFYESLGSFFGGITFSFIFINFFNPLGTISLLCFFSILIILKNNKKYYFFILVPLIVLLFSGGIEKNIFSYVWEKTHTGKLMTYERTKYQTVVVESLSGQMVNVYGNGIILYSLPDRYESRGIFHLINALRKDNYKKILIFGSGTGSLLFNLTCTDIEYLYYFEPDPDLWRIVEPYRKLYYPEMDPRRLHVVFEDFRSYLTHTNELFDMIICLPPPPENIQLNRFYTQEFYSLCKKHLTNEGLFITSIPGFINFMNDNVKNYISSIYKSFFLEFPDLLRTTGDTIYLIGTKNKSSLPEEINKLIVHYRSNKIFLSPKNKYENEIMNNFSAEELNVFFEKTQQTYFNRMIHNNMSNIDQNRDLKPKGYWSHIILSSFQDDSVIYRVINGFLIIPLILLMITGFVFFDLRIKCTGMEFFSGFIMYIIGLISISTMLLMILLYQNFEGIVFYKISMINSAFMVGLASGSYLTGKKNLSLSCIFIFIILSLLSIYMYTMIGIESIFWVVLFVFSFFCGSIFPVLFSLKNKSSYHIMASVLDSMDHCGSIIGSLLTVLFLLPFVGVTGTIFFNIAMVIVAFVSSSVYYKNTNL